MQTLRPLDGAPAQRPRLLLVDALRGVAASMVMLYHLYNAISPSRELLIPDFVHDLLKLGEGGVQVFFVLSGFVIAQNLDELASVTPAVVGRFMLRRSVRLDPVYWVVIALNAAFLVTLSTSAHGSGLGPRVVAENMLYLNGVLGDFFIVPVGWTLTFEVQFYLALAALVGVARLLARGTSDTAARAIVFAPMLAASVWLAFSTAPVRSSPWALAAWHMFFLGTTASWLANKRDHAAWFVAIALASTTAVFAVTHEPVTLLALATGAALTIAARRDFLRKAIGGRPLQWLGKISYSLYLLHPLIGNKLLRFAASHMPHDLSVVEEQLLRWTLLVVAAAVCCAGSWLLWRFVEKPAQRLARKIALTPAGANS